jgi:pimeloyl-ACP methyl ester carboxylesterase
VREDVVVFGRGERMVGVRTTPNVVGNAPHLVILNAGFVHHVGPGRLAVEIARCVAALGFPAVRFDFSGIGESPPRVPALDAIAGGIADAKEAMNRLAEAHGAKRFVMLGLCSGARQAHQIALADPRVVGAILLDGPVYPTIRSLALRVAAHLADPMALFARARRRTLRLFRSTPLPKLSADEGNAFFPSDPSRGQMAEDLRRLVSRGFALLYICSGEWRTYLYQGQLRAAFRDVPLDGVLTERLFESADHLYFTWRERTALLETIGLWLRERFAN